MDTPRSWGCSSGYTLFSFSFLQVVLDVSRRGKKMLNSSRDRNEGTYRSREGGEGSAM